MRKLLLISLICCAIFSFCVFSYAKENKKLPPAPDLSQPVEEVQRDQGSPDKKLPPAPDLSREVRDQRHSRSYLFDQKLDKTTQWGQKPGAVKELYNMRRPAPGVPIGWAVRSGSTLFNTTALESGSSIEGLFHYRNAEHSVTVFLAQVNAKIYAADSTTPPDSTTTFGTSVYTLTSGTSPGFADHVNDDWVFAASGQTPLAWSGGTTYADAVMVYHDSDADTSLYFDGWQWLRDGETGTTVLWLQDTGDTAYVGFRRRLDGLYLYLGGTTNIMASGLTVHAWRDGAWYPVSGFVDATTDGSGVTTLYQSGSVSWTYSAEDDPYLMPGTQKHLFWYRVRTTADVTNGVPLWKLSVNDNLEPITNLWSGLYDLPLACLLSSGTGFVDYSGEISDGSDVDYADLSGLTTGYALYIGFANPAFAIYMEMVEENANLSVAANATVKYWDEYSNGWVTVGTVSDGTQTNGFSLNHTGAMQWDGQAIREHKRSLGGIFTPLYWYEITWSANLPSTVYLAEVGYSQKSSTIPPVPKYAGVIEHNARAFWFPGNTYKNSLDFSTTNRPHVMNGPDAGSTPPIFGPGTVNAMARISSYALVSTKDPYRLYLLQGKVPGKFDEMLLSSQVGVVAPHSLVVIEDAIGKFSTTRSVNAAMFLAPDGFYMCDGLKPIKVDQLISNYFDTAATPYIEPSYAHLSYAWVDYTDRTVHFAVPIRYGASAQTTLNRELVYAYASDEWYDTYHRPNPASCGMTFVGNNNERLSYIGDYSGFTWNTHSGTNDAGTAIAHYLDTSDFSLLQGKEDALNYSAKLRAVKLKSKSGTTGSVWLSVYPDDATTGTTPGYMSLIRAGYNYVQDKINCDSQGELFSFRFRSGDSVGAVMDMPGFSVDFYPVRETN